LLTSVSVGAAVVFVSIRVTKLEGFRNEVVKFDIDSVVVKFDRDSEVVEFEGNSEVVMVTVQALTVPEIRLAVTVVIVDVTGPSC